MSREPSNAPTPAMIRAGYLMMRARENFSAYDNDYLEEAIEAVLAATAELKADHGMYRNEASTVLRRLYEAQHVQIQWREGTGRVVPRSVMNMQAENIGVAHYEASQIIARYGFRPPNAREFAEHGAGGGGR